MPTPVSKIATSIAQDRLGHAVQVHLLVILGGERVERVHGRPEDREVGIGEPGDPLVQGPRPEFGYGHGMALWERRLGRVSFTTARSGEP